MERQKRIYPAERKRTWQTSMVLLAAAALVVVSGLAERRKNNGFVLDSIPQPTAVPMSETFDETMTETVVELPAESWYALQVGVFENEESAEQASVVFRKRGAAGYLWQDGRYRVLAAAYPDKEDAQLVRDQLREKHDIDSYLYAIEFPSLSLRLCGMQGQIDILKAAFQHAMELALQIHEMSVQMDRQELSVEEMTERSKALNTQMALVALRLRQRFSAPLPDTVYALICCFENYGSFAESLTGKESAASMGMQLKYQHFVTLQHIQEMYQTLNHT